MTRMHAAAFVVVALLAACASLSPESGELPVSPHGGTGLFRELTRDETGITGTPRGRALAGSQQAMDAAWLTPDGTLFYAGSAATAAAPPPDPTLPLGDVDWSVLPPRAIFRSPAGDDYGYEIGTMVLEVAPGWEGASVRSPCVVVLGDGRARLYYEADGGIGVAEAPSVHGAFSRVGAAPVVAAPGARRPSATAAPNGDGYVLYYELDGAIFALSSTDGLSFPGAPAAVAFPSLDLPPSAPAEVGVGSPAAVTVRTGVGRDLVRMYAESRRADGTRFVHAAGSADGFTFDRYFLPVIDVEDARDPVPRILDARTTLLYITLSRVEDDREIRALVGSVAPRDADLGLAPVP